MSNIKKFIDFMNDDLALWNEFWDRPVTTTYRRGVLVDPEKFDITPRPEYKRQLITAKEDRLKKLEEEIDSIRKDIKELRQ